MDFSEDKEIQHVVRSRDREFQRLENLHRHYDDELVSLNKNHCLTQDQEVKRRELKKLKLLTKDRMTEIIRQYRSQMQG